MSFLTELRARGIKAPPPDGALAGRSAFVLAYNALLATGRSFAYDLKRDRYFCDGIEIDGGTLAELRLACAKAGRQAAETKTVRDAARALCKSSGSPQAIPPPFPPLAQSIAELLGQETPLPHDPSGQAAQGQDALVRTITAHGSEHLFVAMRDLMTALDLRGAKGAAKVRTAMKALGWRAKPAIVYGLRMRGFWLKA